MSDVIGDLFYPWISFFDPSSNTLVKRVDEPVKVIVLIVLGMRWVKLRLDDPVRGSVENLDRCIHGFDPS